MLTRAVIEAEGQQFPGVIRIQHDRVLLVIADAEGILGLFRSSGQADIMCLLESMAAEHLFLPVIGGCVLKCLYCRPGIGTVWSNTAAIACLLRPFELVIHIVIGRL